MYPLSSHSLFPPLPSPGKHLHILTCFTGHKKAPFVVGEHTGCFGPGSLDLGHLLFTGIGWEHQLPPPRPRTWRPWDPWEAAEVPQNSERRRHWACGKLSLTLSSPLQKGTFPADDLGKTSVLSDPEGLRQFCSFWRNYEQARLQVTCEVSFEALPVVPLAPPFSC